LSYRHQGSLDEINQSYTQLYTFTSKHGLISDEFGIEIYPDKTDPLNGPIDLFFVIHNWNHIFSNNIERVLGPDARDEIMQGAENLTIESSPHERFLWAKGAMQRIALLADDFEKYDIISSCAHVFPKTQIAKLHNVYIQAREESNDSLTAVDAVIQFMDTDPGWGDKQSYREGNIVYSTKAPRDAKGHAEAKTIAEKRRAYCFCPIVNQFLDEGMPIEYCNCGGGWFRQQWEGALEKPVRVEVMKSILNGDDVCQFAVHLPDDL
jgi:hypothetical protein